MPCLRVSNLITLLDSNSVPRLEVAANTTAIYAPNGTLAEVITADGTAYFATNVFITNGVLHLGSASLVLSNSLANTVFYEGGVAVLDLRPNAVTIATNLIVTGTLTGNGAGLTNLLAASIATGTIPDARLSSNVLSSVGGLSVGYTTLSGFGRFLQGMITIPAARFGFVTNSGDSYLSPNNPNGFTLATAYTLADTLGSVFTSLVFSNLVSTLSTLSFTSPNLYSLEFPELVAFGGMPSISSAVITNFSCPKLRFISVAGPAWTLPSSLTKLELSNLEVVIGSAASVITLSPPGLRDFSLPALTAASFALSGANVGRIDLPSLEMIPNSAGFYNCWSLTNFNAPKLRDSGGGLVVNSGTNLLSITLPALTNGPFNFSSLSKLTNISCPAMISSGGVTLTGCSNLTSLAVGSIGSLKSSGNMTLPGTALDQSTVNYLLALLVSLDGSNGTTLWGTGKTLSIGGGTSAAPSGQGITDKATLQARGATVTTN